MKKAATRPLVLVLAAALVLVVGGSLAACSALGGDSDNGAAATVRRFADALDKQNSTTAADLTTAPAPAAEVLGASIAGMHASKVDAVAVNPEEYSDGTATFSLKTTWTLGPGREWTATTQGSARKLSVGWRVQWDPELLAAGLVQGGALRAVRTDARPAPVVRDRAGASLMNLQGVTDIVVDPARLGNAEASAAALAKIVAPVAPQITSGSVRQTITGAGGKPVTVASVRDSDFAALDGSPASIPGTRLVKRSELVLINRQLVSPLHDGLDDYWQALRDATSGWAVEIANPAAGPRRMGGQQGPAAPDVRTSFDTKVQARTKRAVVEVAQPATMLVMDTGSGAILSAAQNDAAIAQKAGVTDQFTPGRTLDPVLSAIKQAAGDGTAKYQEQLDRLGLGVGFSIPGVRPTGGKGNAVDTQLSIRPVVNGSGVSSVSVLNMAVLAAAVARGNSVAPSVIAGQQAKLTDGKPGPVDPAVLTAIRSAMRTTVATGDASDLSDKAGLQALVGTNGPQGPGWFVGVKGNQAIVIYCAGEKSGSAALQVMQRYLRTAS